MSWSAAWPAPGASTPSTSTGREIGEGGAGPRWVGGGGREGAGGGGRAGAEHGDGARDRRGVRGAAVDGKRRAAGDVAHPGILAHRLLGEARPDLLGREHLVVPLPPVDPLGAGRDLERTHVLRARA